MAFWRYFVLAAPVVLVLIALSDLVGRPERQNACAMTYMYQMPRYSPVRLDKETTKNFPNYGLYLYGERDRPETTTVRGIPVIFVPGNAGSHEQVRSLASVALTTSQSRRTSFRFDYYAIDFNEEFSAFSGSTIRKQTEFLRQVIDEVRQLYIRQGLADVQPILIGHSVGGTIIASLFAQPDFQSSVVQLAISLASPLRSPVIPTDSHMNRIYAEIKTFFRHNRSKLNHVNFISIGGGNEDILVPSRFTTLPAAQNQNQDLNLDSSSIMTSIPGVTLTTDHLAIVWCNQLVLKINRILFDLVEQNQAVNPRSGQFQTETQARLIGNATLRSRIIKYHLFYGNRGKVYPKYYIPSHFEMTSPEESDWRVLPERVNRFEKKKIIKTIKFLIPLARKDTVVLHSQGIIKQDWVLACNATQNDKLNLTYCSQAINLTGGTKSLPNELHEGERRFVRASGSALVSLGYTHLLVNAPTAPNQIKLLTERYSTSRKRNIVLPSRFRSLLLFFKSVEILKIPISEQSTYYNVSLIGLSSLDQAYGLKIRVDSCYPTATVDSSAHVSGPWAAEDRYLHFDSVKGTRRGMSLKLVHQRPRNASPDQYPTVQLYLDPDCGYTFEVEFLLIQSLTQTLRHYGIYLLVWCSALMISFMAAFLSQTSHPSPADSAILQLNGSPAGQPVKDPATAPKRLYFQKLYYLLIHKWLSSTNYGLVYLLPVSVMVFFCSVPFLEPDSLSPIMDFSFWHDFHTNPLDLLTVNALLGLAAYSLLTCVTFTSHLTLRLMALLMNFLLTSNTQSQSQPVSAESDTSDSTQQQQDGEEAASRKLATLIPVIGCLLLCLLLPGGSFAALFVALAFQSIKTFTSCRQCITLERRAGCNFRSTLWHTHYIASVVVALACLPSLPGALGQLKSIARSLAAGRRSSITSILLPDLIQPANSITARLCDVSNLPFSLSALLCCVALTLLAQYDRQIAHFMGQIRVRPLTVALRLTSCLTLLVGQSNFSLLPVCLSGCLFATSLYLTVMSVRMKRRAEEELKLTQLKKMN